MPALIEHHEVGAYRLSLSRSLQASSFSIHDPIGDRLVALGVIDGANSMLLRLQNPERDQLAVQELSERILDIWCAMQAALIVERGERGGHPT